MHVFGSASQKDDSSEVRRIQVLFAMQAVSDSSKTHNEIKNVY